MKSSCLDSNHYRHHIYPTNLDIGKYRPDIKHPPAAWPPPCLRLHANILGQVDKNTLQKLLTHKDPKMTQRYARLRDETLKKASNLAGDIIKIVGSSPEKLPKGSAND